VAIRLGVLAFLALALQLLVIYGPLGSGDVQRRALLVVSYLLALAFVAANVRRAGIAIIGVGLLLNFVAITSNGGLMPISPDTLERTGETAAEVSPGKWVPTSKDVLLESEDTRLSALTDRFVWKNRTGVAAFSLGDVLVVTGLGVTIAELMAPRLQRTSGNRSGVTGRAEGSTESRGV
jgi:hypothetical protein